MDCCRFPVFHIREFRNIIRLGVYCEKYTTSRPVLKAEQHRTPALLWMDSKYTTLYLGANKGDLNMEVFPATSMMSMLTFEEDDRHFGSNLTFVMRFGDVDEHITCRFQVHAPCHALVRASCLFDGPRPSDVECLSPWPLSSAFGPLISFLCCLPAVAEHGEGVHVSLPGRHH